jgi:hypothetical protein
MLSTQAIGFGVLLMACSSPPQNSAPPASETKAPPPAPAEPAPAQDKQYDLKGQVVGIDKETNTVSVAGEEVPGFMGAMTGGTQSRMKRPDDAFPGSNHRQDHGQRHRVLAGECHQGR